MVQAGEGGVSRPTHYRVVAPHFVAVISTGGHVSRTGDEWILDAPPILAWARRKPMDEFHAYAQRKGWSIRKFVQP